MKEEIKRREAARAARWRGVGGALTTVIPQMDSEEEAEAGEFYMRLEGGEARREQQTETRTPRKPKHSNKTRGCG